MKKPILNNLITSKNGLANFNALNSDQRVKLVIQNAKSLANGNILQMKRTADSFAEKIENTSPLPYHKIFYGLFHYFSGKLEESELELEKLTRIIWPSNEIQGYVELLRGSNLRSLGALNQAVICINKSLTLLKPLGEFEVFRCFGYYHLGGINMLFEDYEKSEMNFLLCFKSTDFTGHRTAEFRASMGLANLYIKTDKLKKGNELIKQAEELAHDNATRAVVLFEKSIYLFKTNKFEKALSQICKCIELRRSSNLLDAVNTALIFKAEILISLNRVQESIIIGTKVLTEVIANHTKIKERNCLKVLSIAYENTEDFKTAFNFLKAYESLNKTLIHNQYREILKHKNNFITEQRNEIYLQHQEIKSSIIYSKNLQIAILPSQKILESCLPNHFVLYLPKDIVAGDFYWISSPEMRSVNNVQENWVLFASADCTGHGVPGAIVSFICSDLLNRAVNEFKLIDPAKILDKVTELIIMRFGMNNHLVTDGMDISIAAFNKVTKELKWAGANNSLLKVSNGELQDIKGNRQGIGYYRNIKPFTSHSVPVKKNDIIYLGTDGYPDQFGGEKGKKMTHRVYKEKLIELSELPLQKQKKELENFLKTWSRKEEQLDDVCILGVKF